MLADTLTHELVPLRGGQTVHDRQDKAALSPHRFRQADTKGKSIKRGTVSSAAQPRKENRLYNHIHSC